MSFISFPLRVFTHLTNINIQGDLGKCQFHSLYQIIISSPVTFLNCMYSIIYWCVWHPKPFINQSIVWHPMYHSSYKSTYGKEVKYHFSLSTMSFFLNCKIYNQNFLFLFCTDMRLKWGNQNRWLDNKKKEFWYVLMVTKIL